MQLPEGNLQRRRFGSVEGVGVVVCPAWLKPADGDLAVAGGGLNGTIALAPRGGGQGFVVDLTARNARFGGGTPLAICVQKRINGSTLSAPPRAPFLTSVIVSSRKAPASCSFAPRCGYAQPRCTERLPPNVQVSADRTARCG